MEASSLLSGEGRDAHLPCVAADAGFCVDPRPFVPVVQSVLATERETRWLERDLSDGPESGTVRAGRGGCRRRSSRHASRRDIYAT